MGENSGQRSPTTVSAVGRPTGDKAGEALLYRVPLHWARFLWV